MPEPWEDYAAAAPAPAAAPPPQEGPWAAYGQSDQPRPDPAAMLRLGLSTPVTHEMVNSDPGVSSVARAFTAGFGEGFGQEQVGFSDASMQFLIKHGIFRNDQTLNSPTKVVQAFNESFFYPAATFLDAAVRLPNALYRGAQAAGVAAGLPGDVVSMPDAFLGSPHFAGIPHPPGTLPVFREIVPAAAKEGEAVAASAPDRGGIVAYHGSPYSFERFDTSKIGTGEGNKVQGHGLYFAETEGVARSYQVQLGGPDGGHLYQVKIDANPEHFLDWDKPLNEQSQYVRDAFKKLGQEETWEMPVSALGEPERMEQVPISAEQAYNFFAEQLGDEGGGATTAQKLIEAGIPGIKYLDQGSREGGEGTRNYVVFNDQAVRITHVNGNPVATARDLSDARDLGVIGPKPEPINTLPPAKAAAAAVRRDDVLQGPEPGGTDPWQQRFERFAGKLDTPQDIQQLIIDSAKDNDGFVEARQGNIPLSQVEAIANAAGVDPESVNQSGLGRLLKNDNAVRGAVQVMLDAVADFKEASRIARSDPSVENLIAVQDKMMRRDLAVEQIVGLRAEWGRTGRVYQEFMRDVRDQQGLTDFLKGKGRSLDDLKSIADAVAGLDTPEQIARFANDLRKPSAWDKYMFYWVNALISGPVTHIKYIGANAAFAGYEAGVVTPIAGAIGTIRRIATGAEEGVYVGESAARLYGLLAGTPDALKAAWRAARENIQVPLPGEVAKNVNPLTNQKPNPIGGLTGTIVGIPSRGATGIHSFFNFLGWRAAQEAEAYRAAAKEGLSPFSDSFWRRQQSLATDIDALEKVSPGARDRSIDNGYHLTFISEQGKFGKAISSLTREVPALKLIVPFTHIPGQILRAGLEQTPAAFIDERMRADLLGKNGAVAQDTQIARMVAGGIVGGMVANWALNDAITGYGPTDQTERAIWLRTHEPYSVRLGGWWVSYNKFGPIGDLMGLVANLVDIGPKVKEGEYSEAAGRVIKATGRLLEDEVGMQGLVNVIEAMDDPDRKMGRFLSGQAASNLPFSSFLRQTASAGLFATGYLGDPYMREAKTFVDQLRYAVPFARQGLLPKRDWLGQPMDNPGYATILRTRAVNPSPVDREITQLQIKPGPPQDRIGGVKLTPNLYDEYQATAGSLTRTLLESMVSEPAWGTLPPIVRETAIHHAIEGSRRAAEAAMQARHPELIQAGVQQRQDHIMGVGPARPKYAPATLQ